MSTASTVFFSRRGLNAAHTAGAASQGGNGEVSREQRWRRKEEAEEAGQRRVSERWPELKLPEGLRKSTSVAV